MKVLSVPASYQNAYTLQSIEESISEINTNAVSPYFQELLSRQEDATPIRIKNSGKLIVKRKAEIVQKPAVLRKAIY